MNFRDLHYLVAAADTEHFGQAALQCNVSQPTLSGQIRKLEETLGVTLFERSHRSVVITDAGRDIAAHARQILEQITRLESLAQSRQNPLSGSLRIGIIPTLCAYLLPHFLKPLQQKYPDLQPVLFEETTSKLVERLREHQIDVAVLATHHDGDDLYADALFNEPLWMAMPCEHPLAARESINGDDLRDLPMLTLAEGHCLADRVREVCDLSGKPAYGAADLSATSLETLLQLVAAGQGVTLIPALAVHHSRALSDTLLFLPLQLPEARRQIRLVYRRSSSRLPAIEGLANVLKQTLPEKLRAS